MILRSKERARSFFCLSGPGSKFISMQITEYTVREKGGGLHLVQTFVKTTPSNLLKFNCTSYFFIIKYLHFINPKGPLGISIWNGEWIKRQTKNQTIADGGALYSATVSYKYKLHIKNDDDWAPPPISFKKINRTSIMKNALINNTGHIKLK